jgi:heat shock protein HtpX
MEAGALPIWIYVLAIIIGILFIATIGFFLFFSDRIMLRWYRVRVVEDSRVNTILQDLAAKAEISVPRLYAMDSEAPNVFSVGSPRRASIVITSAAMDVLDEEELEGVLAHEAYHIKNGLRIRTASAAFAGVLTSMATAALWGSLLLGFGQEHDPAPRLIRSFTMALFAPHAAMITRLANERSREFEADEYSANLCNPEKLARALEKMDRQMPINPSHAHLFIMNPLKEETFNFLFDSHPALSERIRRLEGLK